VAAAEPGLPALQIVVDVAELAWQDWALCSDVDPELWFPARDTPNSNDAAAKRICAACPVRDECLQYALTVPLEEDFGIWGGTTEAERQAMQPERHGFRPPRCRNGHRRTGENTRRDEAGRIISCLDCHRDYDHQVRSRVA
jgi:WhiB family redox-sensing transcriptional regulator